MTTEQSTPFNRVPLYIALGLSVTLVIGTLIGAKIVYRKAALQPVSMATIDSPDAGSPECGRFLGALPGELLGHPRAELADPAPEGAAAWRSDSLSRITLRCGVSLPLQYTTLSGVTEVDGTSWIRVDDATTGSSLRTWFAVNRFPVVAVTADDRSVDGDDSPVGELSGALGSLDRTENTPAPAPLADLVPGDSDEGCDRLLPALPETLGGTAGYTRVSAERIGAAGLPAGSAAWTAEGAEPVVLRCGVADAPSYEPGVQVQQVNDVAWFNDTALANGTTSGTWYALGRTSTVAVSMPQAAGNTAIVTLGDAIARNIPGKPGAR
ncbi:DUF3515 domain-containing protein [Corynebacterium pygosceleis]|uniref:DUF3515 domain-containing protein n=1 Tax=Corynebacterium pygosceleis TaxID=2800406 RepID=A0A9Q4C7U0_9CORY|nr:DUF3515 domain-containing protein [Corynebacterium pygosceleis]MCK7637820.1 DUF3515 domain-containing protein [Corynebacterium pygosceleis]MCK7675534.1 DUF3515 domain-containing protein [Corynebacterium pygosceleis]MCL0121072.1 DUF3515 domain-containing protein [Corynebacterium pygosceleis]MCX7444640.1 DUF3515 domain-containing protein [Corynebacterium pygosceleis]MCX7468536.1 DUF3515 domain-containing protein [Corynebacterium pygosceleis]